MHSDSSNSWNQPFEPVPAPGGDLRDIAYFVRDVLCDIHEREPTRREMREFCESVGFSWNHVVGELRRQEFARHVDMLRPGVLDDAEFAKSKSGITVNVVRLIELMGDLRTRCPFVMPFVNSWTFQRASVQVVCGSWCCPDCGLSNAESLLQQVRMRIVELPDVYVGETPWESGLASRMARRRADRRMNMFWYHRLDGSVFFVADKPFNATSSPASCRRLTPGETLAWLVREVLWVPGHVRHGFSQGWDFPVDKKSGGDLISLAGLTDPEIVTLMKTFADEVQARFGVRVDCGDIPRQHHDALVDLMKTLIEKARSHLGGPDVTAEG